jgi:hypothetical protein
VDLGAETATDTDTDDPFAAIPDGPSTFEAAEHEAVGDGVNLYRVDGSSVPSANHVALIIKKRVYENSGHVMGYGPLESCWPPLDFRTDHCPGRRLLHQP